MCCLVKWAADATVFDFTTIGKRPAHVPAEAFCSDVFVIDVANHEGFQTDGDHFGLSRFEFLKFYRVLPYHQIHPKIVFLPFLHRDGTLGQ